MQRSLEVKYEYYDSWKSLDESDIDLVKKAYDVMENAYAPYSKFRVGASLLMEDGTLITGSNQENIAYPSGLCAERVALFYAGANYPDKKINTLCVVAKGDLVPTEEILSPCGGCRQVMLETENRQGNAFRVILVSQNEKTVVFNSARDLLPLAFGVRDEN